MSCFSHRCFLGGGGGGEGVLACCPWLWVMQWRGGGQGKTYQIIGGLPKNAREKSKITIAPLHKL